MTSFFLNLFIIDGLEGSVTHTSQEVGNHVAPTLSFGCIEQVVPVEINFGDNDGISGVVGGILLIECVCVNLSCCSDTFPVLRGEGGQEDELDVVGKIIGLVDV